MTQYDDECAQCLLLLTLYVIEYCDIIATMKIKGTYNI